MLDMAASPCIQCRIDPQLKSRLRAIAVERGLTESALLKRLVVGSIRVVPTTEAKLFAIEPIGPRARVYVRLRPGDHALLRERAERRGLASATYVSMLVRNHLRLAPPLPDRELVAQARRGGAGRGRSELESDRPRRTPDRPGGRADDRRPSSDSRGLRRIAGSFQTPD